MNSFVLTDTDIWHALRACYSVTALYPKAVNVVDLGLIERIDLRLDANAPGSGIPGVPERQALRLVLASGFGDEDEQAQVMAQIANRMAGLPALTGTVVDLAATPWTEARISPEGRRILGLDAARFPILNNRSR